MAEIKGITFSNQAVTPKDDGQLRSRLLHDGVISGFSMSFSAATFSIAAGYLIAAGRLLRNPATVLLAVDQATSGYARILLTLDLTRTATKDEFDQALLSVDYSSTLGGFPSLVQGDINGSDTTYQTVLAIVALSPGGISSIVWSAGSALLCAGKNYRLTLAASGWDAETLTYTLAVPEATADPLATNILTAPAGRAATAAYQDAGVMCLQQLDGALVYECESIPGDDIPVNITVMG